MRKHFTTLALLMLVLSSCVTPLQQDQRIVMLGNSGASLSATGAKLLNAEGSPLFNAQVANVSTMRSCEFSWCVEFFNAQGVQVAVADTRWQSVNLAPRDTCRLQLTASDPSVVDFTLKIKD
jgi:hypothetical protein